VVLYRKKGKMTMAIKDLLVNLQDESNLLLKLDLYLESQPSQRKPDGMYHPSMAGQCPRAIYYYQTGLAKKSFSPETIRRMDNGTKVHERMQEYFENMGILLEKEKPIKFTVKSPAPSITVTGSCDGIILLNKEKHVLEIKSANNFMFGKFVKEGYDSSHFIQWNLYSYGCKIWQGLLLYENKDNQKLHVYNLKFDRLHSTEPLRSLRK